MRNRLRLTLHFLLAFIGAMALAQTASAAVNCNNLARIVTVDHIDINQRHIFCGEIGRYGAVGFHAQPGGQTPGTITFDGYSHALVVSQWQGGHWQSNGIYELDNFLISDGHDQFNKAKSTMFPDHCSKDDVLVAIAYAAQHNNMSGPSCVTTQGSQFELTLYWLHDNTGWYVNTAYPRT
ncbi:EndoU domain-containing protein [Thalassospira mesophila]|uniref:Bacterial EndoU nuclease domain-containing protein n=1 Tax=Thalassospira mesophila TaxID=1293891 RepID=A0A1Y2L4L3_9PROT|nr:EndoU domain-containing protein [Thalassospira mesophila]OSQ40767.1 hypothetical protein TMES_03515 [Thalassospira mesophila]